MNETGKRERGRERREIERERERERASNNRLKEFKKLLSL